MDRAIQDFINYLEFERRVSVHTIRNYTADLFFFRSFIIKKIPPGKKGPLLEDVDHWVIRGYLAFLFSQGLKRASIARKLSSIRSFFSFLQRRGKVSNNPSRIISTPRQEKRVPKVLSIDQAKTLVELPKEKNILNQIVTIRQSMITTRRWEG